MGCGALALHYNRGAILDPWSRSETSYRFWTLCRHGDVDFLRAGKTQPLVHLRFRRRVRAGFGLWLSARRMALRSGGSRLVGGGAPALVASARSPLTFLP